jgi:hypothetical protein
MSDLTIPGEITKHKSPRELLRGEGAGDLCEAGAAIEIDLGDCARTLVIDDEICRAAAGCTDCEDSR